ncbi:hypothetical protein EQG49_12785 [Periweissella cryptocerci]|uniref:DUF2190 family protein n=1 Tax=Periweissella cryptocerci TaxID=2506420 RepID=A0A4P6YWN3_9LACO|nr:hypothetical protein [Periweissella cryptocerci]QBO37272.1 hypothetical protein EQG49_12785 [Periweissella cryptocerci]
MPIPEPKKYMDSELGLGKISSFQSHEAKTRTSGATIAPGTPLQTVGGVVTALTNGKFAGVAIAKNFVKELDYDGVAKNADYEPNEPVPVLTKGGITVIVGEDVVTDQLATVRSGKFMVATPASGTGETYNPGDAVVGIFESNGLANGTAIVKINLA